VNEAHAAGRQSPTRVVVVEDSNVQRAHLVRVLEAEGDIAVVGEAIGGAEAIAMVARLLPDVVTLDLQIPDGGGQHALEHIMAATPTAVVVLSGTVRNAESAPAIDALVAGAMLAVPKPLVWTAALEHELRRNVRMLRKVPAIRRVKARLRPGPAFTRPADAAGPPSAAFPTTSTAMSSAMVVAVAASTGGPPALATVLAGLAGLDASVLIVQHLHPDFVDGLVAWMARVSPLPVVLATHGQALRRGCVHIAPGGHHLRLGSGMRLELSEHPATIHRPSANELFSSVARYAGAQAVGVLLTGMGDDGATGLVEMHRSGAHTIAQDEATCAVYGMPRAAERLGAVDRLLPLPSIGDAIRRAVSLRPVRR
jgi:two-component system chemotaxis response regulator CheB